MMIRKNGIPVDVPSLRPQNKLNKVVKKSSILNKRWYNYIELEKSEGVTVIVPLDSVEYELSLKEGYTKELDRWKIC